MEYLNDAFLRKLTLISAPAGFGKSTLISEWIHQSKKPVAWLGLDEADNDATRFLTYLISILQTIQSELGKAMLARIQELQGLPIEHILTELINEIGSTFQDGTRLHRIGLVMSSFRGACTSTSKSYMLAG